MLAFSSGHQKLFRYCIFHILFQRKTDLLIWNAKYGHKFFGFLRGKKEAIRLDWAQAHMLVARIRAIMSPSLNPVWESNFGHCFQVWLILLLLLLTTNVLPTQLNFWGPSRGLFNFISSIDVSKMLEGREMIQFHEEILWLKGLERIPIWIAVD